MYFPLLRYLIAFVFITSLTGCRLTPVKNEIPLVTGDISLQQADPNYTKLLIFNASNYLMFGIDGTGRINVMLNGKGVAHLNIYEYAQLIVPKGKHKVSLVHRDIVHLSSEHEIDLVNAESFLKVYATVTSNRAKLVAVLPKNFDKKFKRANADFAYPPLKRTMQKPPQGEV
jgi:hypothetical protein